MQVAGQDELQVRKWQSGHCSKAEAGRRQEVFRGTAEIGGLRRQQKPVDTAQPQSATPVGEIRRTAELSELEGLSQGGARSTGWCWADAAEEEEAHGELHPERAPVRVPEAPPEAQEPPDSLPEHGESFGSAGQGRAPLPRQVSANAVIRGGARVCEFSPMG